MKTIEHLPDISCFVNAGHRSKSLTEISAPTIELHDDTKAVLIRHALINMHLPCVEDPFSILVKAGEATTSYLCVFEALRSDSMSTKDYLNSLLGTSPAIAILVGRFISSCDKYRTMDREDVKALLQDAAKSSDAVIKACAIAKPEELRSNLPKEFTIILRAMYFRDTEALITLSQDPKLRAFAAACSFMQTFDSGTGAYPELDKIVSDVSPSLAKYAKDNSNLRGSAEKFLPSFNMLENRLSKPMSNFINFLEKNK
jgi:hypothetical protein